MADGRNGISIALPAATHLNGSLIMGEDPAQLFQVMLSLFHSQAKLLQLLLLVFKHTEFLIDRSLRQKRPRVGKEVASVTNSSNQDYNLIKCI